MPAAPLSSFAGVSATRISEYAPSLRTRLAIKCAYWPPKSKTAILSINSVEYVAIVIEKSRLPYWKTDFLLTEKIIMIYPAIPDCRIIYMPEREKKIQ